MALLDKAAILAATDLGHEDVAVPEWGGTVRIRVLSGAERDAFESSFATPAMVAAIRARGPAAVNENMRARLVAYAAVGEDGKRLFTDEADLVALGAKSALALDRVFAVAKKLNGMSQADMEEIEKFYGAVLGAGSTSTSPSDGA
jgi:hypothetical protein